MSASQRRQYLAHKFSESSLDPLELVQWKTAMALESDSSGGTMSYMQAQPFNQNGGGGGSSSYRPMQYAGSSSQSLFYPKGCFQDAQANQEDYDTFYCTGNSLILVLSLVNLIVFSVLLVFHFLANSRAQGCTKLLSKVKTMILILVVLLQLSVFVRYTFSFESEVAYDAILIISGFVQSIILFQICYFYTKKAAHFLEDNSKTRKLMRHVMYSATVIFLAFAVYQFWDKKIIRNKRSGLCHTFYFILPNIVNQIVNAFFFYIGIKVERAIRAYNSHQMALNSPKTNPNLLNSSVNELLNSAGSSSSTKSSLREIEFRKRSLRNMWTMILTIFAVDTYCTLYSITLYFFADTDCYIQDTSWIRSLSTVVERSIQFIWWLYPVMWLFWPSELSCRKKKQTAAEAGDKSLSKRKRRASSHLDDPDGNAAGQLHSDEEEDDEGSSEGEYNGRHFDSRSSVSNVNLNQQATGTAMFGGMGINGQPTFMLLPNATADGTSSGKYGQNFSSSNNLSSNESSINSAGYRREGTFRIDRSPTTGGRDQKKKSGRNEFSMVSPMSDHSVDLALDRDF